SAAGGDVVSLFVDGARAGQATVDPALAAGQVMITVGPLADGVHQVTATATNAAGMVSPPTDPIAVTIDTQPPLLALTTPQPGATIRPGDQLTGGMAGTGSAPAGLRYQFNGQAEVTGLVHTDTGAFTENLDLSRLDPGPHGLIVTGTDLAGNTTSVSVNVTV